MKTMIPSQTFIRSLRHTIGYGLFGLGCCALAATPEAAPVDLGESELASPYGGGRITLLNMSKDEVPSDADLRALGQLGGPLSPLKSRIRERRTKVDAEDQVLSRTADGRKMAGRKKFVRAEITGMKAQHPHRARQLEDNAAFGAAMDKWNRHDYKEAAELFRQHRAQHPDSPWVGETALHLACEAQFTGRWDEARQYFESILDVAESGEDIYQKAKLRLAVLAMTQGMVAEAQDGFGEMLKTETDWGRMTYAQNWIRHLSLMKSQLANIRTCGNESIAYILELRGQIGMANVLKAKPAHGDYGYTLAELRDAAYAAGLNPIAVEADISKVAEMPFPWIAHYSDEHFVAVVGQVPNGNYRVFDPRLKAETTLAPAQLSNQWSGLALLLYNQTSLAARTASDEALARIGGCCGVPTTEDDLGDCEEDSDDPACCPCSLGGGGGGPAAGGPGSPAGGPFPPFGMPSWKINPKNMNMVVQDIPLWYDPPYGPPIRITLTYNSLDALNELRPFGPKWTFNYASYVMENPNGEVTMVKSHGRRDVFAANAPAAPAAMPMTTSSSGAAQAAAEMVYDPPKKYPGIEFKKVGNYDFELKQPDGMTHVYGIPAGSSSTTSLLKAIKDAYGNTLTINHASNGRITSIIDAQGKQTVFEYNARGYVSKITDPFGRFCTFSYDEHGRLVSQTDMGGVQYGYEYTEMTVEVIQGTAKTLVPNNLFITAIKKPAGTTSFYIEPTDGDSSIGFNSYPPSGSPMWSNFRITVTDPMGYKLEYHWDGYSGYSWYRDRVQYPLGINDPMNGPKTKYFLYNAGTKSAIQRVEYADGRYEEYGNFNANLKPQYVRDTLEGYHYYTYNDKGQTLTHRYPNGREISYEYAVDGIDLALVKDRPNSSSGWQTLGEYEYNSQGSRIVSLDAAGISRKAYHNDKGQLTTLEVIPAGGTVPAFVFTYSFDSAGYLETIQRNDLVVETYSRDEIGRMVMSTDIEGVVLIYEYDNLNRVTDIYYADGTSEHYSYYCCNVASLTDRRGRTINYDYDANGRLITIQTPLGQNISLAYDAEGHVTKLVDAAGKPFYWDYNNVGRLIKKSFPDGLGYTISYDRDRSVTKTNARGQQLTSNFNNHGQLISVYASNEPTIFYEYDYRGRLTSMENEVGTTRFYYETIPAGRLAQIDGPWNNDIVDYTYDSLGRLASQSINDESVSFTYDALGRVIKNNTPLGEFVYNYMSSQSDRLTQATYPNGVKVHLDYKSVEEGLALAELRYQNASGETLSRFAYDYLSGGGGISAWTQQQGAITKRWDLTYDRIDQLSDLVETDLATGTVTSRESWRYDTAGNRRLAQVNEQPVQAAYNALDQLLKTSGSDKILVQGHTDEAATVTVQGQRARLYDGNRFEAEIPVTEGENTFSIQATDAQGNIRTHSYKTTIFNLPEHTFTYDADGNMLEEKVGTTIIRAFTWDVRNRLKSITVNGTTYSFVYDAMGRRVRELVNGTAHRSWLWTDGHQPDEERDGTGSAVTRRYLGAGMQVIGDGQNQNYFYIKDHLESIRGLVDATGIVQVYYDYDVWGTRSATRLTGSIEADFAFTGHLWHASTQLGLTLYRGYSPQLGRWLSRDPVEEQGGINLYGYVANKPINSIDLLGTRV